MTTCQHLHPVDVVGSAPGWCRGPALQLPHADPQLGRRGSRERQPSRRTGYEEPMGGGCLRRKG